MKKIKNIFMVSWLFLSMMPLQATESEDEELLGNRDNNRFIPLENREIECLVPFLYQEDGQGIVLKLKANERLNYYRRFAEQNDYPFSLPQDTVVANTVCFNQQNLEQASRNPEVLSIIQKKIGQIVLTDCSDIRALKVLKGELHDRPTPVGYGLHLFSDVAPDLGGIQELLNEWSQPNSLASCCHLDIAIRNLTDDAVRTSVLETICNIFDLSACENLETLSLRFMHITNADLRRLFSKLKENPRKKLQRLILSYNAITDGAFEADGLIQELLDETENLPNLFYIDLKGNKFIEPFQWDVSARRRKRHLAEEMEHEKELNLIFTFNGFGSTVLEVAKETVLDPHASYEQPYGFKPEDIQTIKNAFDGAASPFLIKKDWILPNSSYANLADILFLLRHGANKDWHTLDLTNLSLAPCNVELIFRHISNPSALRELILTRTFQVGEIVDEQAHANFLKAMRRLTGLLSLSLAGNSLGDIPKIYQNLVGDMKTLKALDLSNNRIGGEDLNTNSFLNAFLCDVRVQENLTVLKLNHNSFTDVNFIKIFKSISLAKKLVFCDLSDNQLQFEEKYKEFLIPPLLDWLKKNKVTSRIEFEQ